LTFRKPGRPITLSWINLPVRSPTRVTRTWANLPIRGKVLVVVTIPLCALLAAAVAYYMNYRADVRAEKWVDHVQDVRTDIQEALIFLLDAETGMRGYLLTGQDVFLSRYQKAAQALPKDLADLEHLVQDQPRLIARMRRTASLVREHLKTLAALRPSPSLAGASAAGQDALMLQSAGIMDAVRLELDGMLAEEERLLAERERQQEDTRKGILFVIGLSLLVGLSSAITASAVFAGAIGGRVRRLEENAGQLARGLPLSPWSPGNDEIGHLAEALERSSVLLADREREMRKAMDLAQTAREEADRANQAKTDFLSRVSHELRTPLNAILGFAQILEMDSLSAEHRDNVEQILKGGRHLLTLIDEVLEISRIEAGRLALSMEPVRVGEAVRDALDLIAPIAAQRRVRINGIEAVACDRHIQADRQRLKQVLLNLLSNAVKYNRDGGEVTLSCEETLEHRMRIQVIDTGPGIPPEKMKRLFSPFDRLGIEHSGVEGSGLGLALSKRLVEAMGGTLGVESVLGAGSTFWTELALTDAPVERVTQARIPIPTKAEFRDGQKAQIVLYIEDNLSNLKLIQHILAHRPEVRLIPAMQGRLGLELAQEHQPALILLDQHLPDITGDEVLRRLQDYPETRHIPVVMITADVTPSHVERLLASGARGYLSKPLDVMKFLAVLTNALQERESSRLEGNAPR